MIKDHALIPRPSKGNLCNNGFLLYTLAETAIELSTLLPENHLKKCFMAFNIIGNLLFDVLGNLTD
jgi:hypothetical protein